MSASTKILRDAAGELQGFLSTQKDFTHLKALRDAKLVDAKFRDLLESTPDAIVMVNITGRISSAIRDVTERKRFGRTIQEASRLKCEFLTSMSHELRTPRNAIIGFSEFPVDERPGALNAKQKEYLQDILNSGRHLLQLINDVLDLSKMEAGKMELFPETFILPAAVSKGSTFTARLPLTA